MTTNKRPRVGMDPHHLALSTVTHSRDNAFFLNKELRFYPKSEIAERLAAIGEQLYTEIFGGATRQRDKAKKLLHIEWTLANLIACLIDTRAFKKARAIMRDSRSHEGRAKVRRRYAVYLPCSPNESAKWGLSHDYSIKIRDHLEGLGLIQVIKGNQRLKKMTRLLPTRQLMGLLCEGITFDALSYAITMRPDEPVLLTEKRDGVSKPIPIKHKTMAFKKMVREVNRINDNNESHVIVINGRKTNPYVFRKFQNDFNTGGRFYGGPGHYMHRPRSERPTITIDGEETVELDFASMVPNLLYASQGMNMPFPDAYLAVYRDTFLRERTVKCILH